MITFHNIFSQQRGNTRLLPYGAATTTASTPAAGSASSPSWVTTVTQVANALAGLNNAQGGNTPLVPVPGATPAAAATSSPTAEILIAGGIALAAAILFWPKGSSATVRRGRK